MPAKKKVASGFIYRWQNSKYRHCPSSGSVTETLHCGVSDKCLVVFDNVSVKLHLYISVLMI